MKNALTIKDLANPNLHNKFNQVILLFRDLSLSSGSGHDAIILEEFGTSMAQLNNTNRGSWYCTYRLHPLYSHLPKLTKISLTIPNKFAKLFGKTDNHAITYENKSDRNACITLIVPDNVANVCIGD